MFLYNVHTPNKTFALPHKQDESHSALIERIANKAGLSKNESTQIIEGKDGGSLVYEFENGRWSLEDDDDLSILQSRLPPSSSSGVTLHLTPPHPRAHFANSPPAYTTASNSIKSKAQSQSQAKPAKSALHKSNANSNSNGNENGNANSSGKETPPIVTEKAPEKPKEKPKSKSGEETFPGGRSLSSGFTALPSSKDYAQTTTDNSPPGKSGNLLGPPAGSKSKSDTNSKDKSSKQTKRSTSGSSVAFAKEKTSDGSKFELPEWYNIPKGEQGDWGRVGKARSVISNKSDRKGRNKWDEAVQGLQPGQRWGDIHKQQWHEFHNNNGVRTVTGKVGDVDNVRMLLKSGYKYVYVSKSFAKKANLVPAAYEMGQGGYTGLKTLGSVAITVGGRTATHPILINEEQHFDVVLGRLWLEKMAIKTDPLDQTNLTYMDSGESIACDIVVLKDEKGNVITIT